MQPEHITDLISLAVTVCAVIDPAVWHLSAKLQGIASEVATVNAEICAELKVIEVRMDAVSEEIKASRKARAEIWREVNTIRERISKLE